MSITEDIRYDLRAYIAERISLDEFDEAVDDRTIGMVLDAGTISYISRIQYHIAEYREGDLTKKELIESLYQYAMDG